MTAPAPHGETGERERAAADRWAGTVWEDAAKLAREVLLADPASWVVYRIGAALADREARGRAEAAAKIETIAEALADEADARTRSAANQGEDKPFQGYLNGRAEATRGAARRLRALAAELSATGGAE